MRLVLRLLWQNFRNHKKEAVILGLLLATTTVLWIVDPLYTSWAIDQLASVLDGKEVDYLKVFGWWGVLLLALAITSGLEKYYTWQLNNHLKMDRREQVYEHVLKLDIDFHTKQRGGEVIQKLEDGAEEIRGLQRILIDLVPSILSAAVFFWISFQINWILSLILMGGVALFVFFSVFLSTRLWKHQELANELWVSSIGRAYDAMTNIFTVKSAAREHDEYGLMKTSDTKGFHAQQKLNRAWAWLEGLNFYMLISVALIAVGTLQLVQGEITLGQLYYFQSIFYRVLTPFQILSGFLPDWNKSVGKIRYAEELLKRDIAVKNNPHAKSLSDLKGEIRFKDVSFTYGDAAALHALDLHVKPGEHIALVGHSGAGKSTIAMLLNRFYDVTDGAILVDGADMRDLDVHWWRSQVGLVLQENISFNDTILENIRYARPSATKEEVIEAAKRASAHDFIEKLPKGYDTMVGERGIRLSGGERQRVAIARAILKQPKIVVLDEATSALDSITERAVQEGIKELIKGRTSFIIAHRLSTVRSVDRIAVLEKGKVVAVGPHEELLKTSPLYKHMVELQHQGMLEDE